MNSPNSHFRWATRVSLLLPRGQTLTFTRYSNPKIIWAKRWVYGTVGLLKHQEWEVTMQAPTTSAFKQSILPTLNTAALSVTPNPFLSRSQVWQISFLSFLYLYQRSPRNNSEWFQKGNSYKHLRIYILVPSMLLFPVDRDTHEIFCRLQSNVCFKPITWYIEMHYARTLTRGRILSPIELSAWPLFIIWNQWQYINDNGAIISGHGIKRALICVKLG